MWKFGVLVATASLSGCMSDPDEASAFAITTVCERTKPVSSAPPGYARTWKESIEAVEVGQANDAEFSRAMREHAARLNRLYYQGMGGGENASYETHDLAGTLNVTQEVTAASPDILSVRMRADYYEAGMAHPDSVGANTVIWSRRWHRPLTQGDVFAVPPDRALRRLALLRFDNPDRLQNPDNPDGIPLPWDRASIGPNGITWFFEPYELGGYVAAGSATIGWPALRPYLRSELPFVISEVREIPATARKQRQGGCA